MRDATDEIRQQHQRELLKLRSAVTDESHQLRDTIRELREQLDAQKAACAQELARSETARRAEVAELQETIRALRAKLEAGDGARG